MGDKKKATLVSEHYVERFEVQLDGRSLEGFVRNDVGSRDDIAPGSFLYCPMDESTYPSYTAEELRAIADQLDVLNVRERLKQSV